MDGEAALLADGEANGVASQSNGEAYAAGEPEARAQAELVRMLLLNPLGSLASYARTRVYTGTERYRRDGNAAAEAMKKKGSLPESGSNSSLPHGVRQLSKYSRVSPQGYHESTDATGWLEVRARLSWNIRGQVCK